MSNTDRGLRAAQNQLMFRSVNERIKELGETILDSVTELDFSCECNDAACHSPITDVEDVVAEHDGYVIVAKRGAGAHLVKEIS
jgi:hypothetical protein